MLFSAIIPALYCEHTDRALTQTASCMSDIDTLQLAIASVWKLTVRTTYGSVFEIRLKWRSTESQRCVFFFTKKMDARVFDAHACPPARGALTHQPIRSRLYWRRARELVAFKDNSQPESSFYCEVNHYFHFGWHFASPKRRLSTTQ